MLLTQMHDLRPTGLGQLGDVECCGLFAVLALHLWFLIAAIALNLVVSRSKRSFWGILSLPSMVSTERNKAHNPVEPRQPLISSIQSRTDASPPLHSTRPNAEDKTGADSNHPERPIWAHSSESAVRLPPHERTTGL